jgi:hypothetical protein
MAKPGPCRILKDETVASLFPVLLEMGFSRHPNPKRWFGWDPGTGSYRFEFWSAPNEFEFWSAPNETER